ncbi:hypothetical protein [Knoellia koreensis]|uniref:Uncharacterized protein n=1 Tax=Knoellia koreensis TaxID=2730921 RepID=A0A849HJD9_9MICO|nr:hypothetical protein [Knoellia sp. DB2414S]NNM46441.1 hypothetical protein [Knoellia sp. DB2414S]
MGPGQRIGELFLGAVAAHAMRALVGLAEDPTKVSDAPLAWEQILRAHAWSFADPLLNNVAPAAFLGHDPDRPVRQQNAEAFFRSKLNKVLPASAPQREIQLEEVRS